MRKTFHRTRVGSFIFFVSLVFLSGPAKSDTLGQFDVAHFTNLSRILQSGASPELTAIEQKVEIALRDGFPVDGLGRVNLYRNTYHNLATASEKQAMREAALEAKFPKRSNWLEVSDRVLGAYVHIKTEREGTGDLPPWPLPEAVAEAMPPDVLAQLTSTFELIEAGKKAPAADVLVVAPHYESLAEVIEED